MKRMNPPKSIPGFRIYADDSIVTDELAVYGLIGCRVELLDSCVRALAIAKAARGIPHNAQLHCKEIYAGDARRKGPYASLSSDEADDLYASVATELAMAISPLVSLGFVRLPNMPREMRIRSLSGKPCIEMPIEKGREKQALAFAFSAALGPFANHLNVPKDECLVVLGADGTKIQWLQSRRQAHHAASTWGHGFQIQVEKSNPLLEVADMVAYFGGHLLAATDRQNQAKRVLHVLQPRIWECRLTPDIWNRSAENHPPHRRFVAQIDDVTDRNIVKLAPR